MKFEDLLEEVGSFGIYQKLLCFIAIPLTTGVAGLTFYAQIFVLTAPDHICNHENSVATNFTAIENKSCSVTNASLTATDKPCPGGWTYDYLQMFPTLTSENNWVCDESWKPYLITTFFWIGNTFGAWIFGVLSDKYGRKPVIAACVSIYAFSASASVFTRNFYLFMMFRTFVGSAHHTASHLVFVYVVEQCGVKSRVIPLLTIMASYTIGSVLSPLLAQAIWDWQILLLVSTLPVLILLLFYRWLLESPSWSTTNGRSEEARKNLEKIAKFNRKEIAEDALASFLELTKRKTNLAKYEDQEATKHSILEVYKYRRLLKNVLLVLMLWMTGCFCYYVHCQNTSNLGGNIFHNFLFGALVEIPAWSAPFAINRFGRKKPLALAFFISGVSGIAYAFTPKAFWSVMLTLALVGRMSVTVAYYITLQYCPEIFPTVIRGQGVAISETMAGIAIFISPLIVYLGESLAFLPQLIFGLLSLVGALGTILLPETAGVPLPQTLQQGQNFGL